MQKIISDKSKALTTEDTASSAMPRTSQVSLQRVVAVSGQSELTQSGSFAGCAASGLAGHLIEHGFA